MNILSDPKILSIFLLLAFGRVSAQDCAIANTVWQTMGGSPALPSSCCNTNGIVCGPYAGFTRITGINWENRGLSKTIHPDITRLNALDYLILRSNSLTGPLPANIGNINNLRTLWIESNRFNGSIPTSIGSLSRMTSLSLRNNAFTGPIPDSIGNLPNLQVLLLRDNRLSGPIPDSIGKLKNLVNVTLSDNQLNGTIPTSLGTLTGLKVVWLHNNQLSGYPSGLLSLPKSNVVIFPNPMSTLPFDVARNASIGVLENTTWDAVFKYTNSLAKRQASSTQVTTADLLKMCPLNNVIGADVAAGCISGIYKTFCQNPLNSALLAQCHDAYNRVFAASYFKPIGDVCPAWMKGPRSGDCTLAISRFTYDFYIGKDTSGQDAYLKLNSTHAGFLVNSILASRTYAPCVAPVTCFW
jgi:hypothetical protein